MGWTKEFLKKRKKTDSFWKKHSKPFKKPSLVVLNSRGDN